MHLEIRTNDQIAFRGWFESADALFDHFWPAPGAVWTLTARANLGTHRRFPCRASLLVATALAYLANEELPWEGTFLTPEGVPDDGRYRQKLIDRLSFHLWKTLPSVFSFQFSGPQAREICYLSCLLLAQADSVHPQRIPDIAALTEAMERFPLKSAIRPFLSCLAHLGQTGVLGFRRIGRPQTSTVARKKELNRLRQARFRERHKKP